MKYIGYRGQDVNWVRPSTGDAATEGYGVYISFGEDLARQFAHGQGHLLKLEFELNHPLVVRESLYILTEADELDEPIQPGDSVWLQASKYAVQEALKETGGHWSEAQGMIGYFLTRYLENLGHDGVIIDQGHSDKWAVVFDVKKVKIV